MDRVFVAAILMVLLSASYIGAQKNDERVNKPGTPGQNIVREMRKYNYEANRKFLNDTKELRKELHNKRFEYYEALKNPDMASEKVTVLEREIWDLQRKIFDTWQKQFY